MSAQEMKLTQSGNWLIASDEPIGTDIPDETERWIATDLMMEVQQ